MKSRHLRERKAVSEVVGALLLIIVVVSAVASLGYFLANAQQQAQNRNQYLTNLHNDNLQVIRASFLPCSPTPCTPLTPTTWAAVNLAVRNTNTLTSGISGIQVNGVWATAWTEVDQSGNQLTPPVSLGAGHPPLLLPPKAIEYVQLIFGSPLATNVLFEVVLLSQAGNYFTTNYYPGASFPQASISSRSSPTFSQDIVTLDGSKSSAVNSSIQSYRWQVAIPTTTSGCTTFDPTPAVAWGETIQYAPENMFTATQLTSDCISGPIQATLTITDSNGFTSTSQPLLVPADPNIDPVGSISASITSTLPCTSPSCTVTVTVHDIFGNPVNGVVVNAISIYGDVKVTPLSATTSGTDGSAGEATFTVGFTSGGSMDFETGSLFPAQLAFP